MTQDGSKSYMQVLKTRTERIDSRSVASDILFFRSAQTGLGMYSIWFEIGFKTWEADNRGFHSVEGEYRTAICAVSLCSSIET
jgi:hypothetical protein